MCVTPSLCDYPCSYPLTMLRCVFLNRNLDIFFRNATQKIKPSLNGQLQQTYLSWGGHGPIGVEYAYGNRYAVHFKRQCSKYYLKLLITNWRSILISLGKRAGKTAAHSNAKFADIRLHPRLTFQSFKSGL